MDIACVKEKIKHGENIDFSVSKKKITGMVVVCVIFALASFAWGCVKSSTPTMIFGSLGGLFLLCIALKMGLVLLPHQRSLVLSINKEYLGIFDNPVFSGRNISCVLIVWKDILDIKLQEVNSGKGSHFYIVLQCIDSAIQNIVNHKKQVNKKGLIRDYELTKNFVILGSTFLLDITTKDLFDLLKEIHKEMTSSNDNY
jgi:hypothetical protein